MRRGRLLALLQPSGSVMDLNIGAALWLATRGAGRLRRPAGWGGAGAGAPGARGGEAGGVEGGGPVAAGAEAEGAGGGGAGAGGAEAGAWYESEARVVLLGHGADEQAGHWPLWPLSSHTLPLPPP